MRSYELEEQETTINLYPKQVSDKAEVYTCIPHMITQLRKLQSANPDDVSITETDGAVDATVPRDWVKIQPKRRSNMTEEQKQAAAAGLAAYRDSQRRDTP